jgi:hypothetical protein
MALLFDQEKALVTKGKMDKRVANGQLWGFECQPEVPRCRPEAWHPFLGGNFTFRVQSMLTL